MDLISAGVDAGAGLTSTLLTNSANKRRPDATASFKSG